MPDRRSGRAAASLSSFALLLAAVAGACGSEESAEPAESPPASAVASETKSRASDRPGKARKGNRRGPGLDPEKHPGRWRAAPSDRQATLTDEQEAQLEQLRAIGYAGGSVKSTREGLTAYSRDSVEPGLNFFTSGDAAVARLMDMHGRILHEWRMDHADAFPDSSHPDGPPLRWWRRARLCENGDVVAIFEGVAIIRIDKDSKLVWKRDIGAHHDLLVRPGGEIFVLTREPLERAEEGDFILEDSLSVLDGETGELVRSISLLDALRGSEFDSLIEQGKRTTGDLFHTNTVHVLDGRLADRDPAFAAGNILTSMNALGVIAVLDPQRRTIVWARRGEWKDVKYAGQHDPRVLDNGHMLFFENNHRPEASRVREIDPLSGEELWFYEGNEAAPFFSPTCGAVQRLANGNTLITSTDAGRVFELDPDGRIAWEYFNPQRAGKNREFIATISEMTRLPLDYADEWLR